MTPRASDRLYLAPSRAVLIASLLGVVLSAAPLIVPGSWIVLVTFWLMLALAMAVDRVLVYMNAPALHAEVPSSAPVGRHSEVPFRLSSKWQWTATTQVEVNAPLRALLDVHASSGILQIDATKRGLGEVRAIWMKRTTPLRTLNESRRFPIAAPISVIPDVERIRELSEIHYRTQNHGGAHLVKRRGEGGEIDSLVTYEPGMELRALHWKASARHNAPLARRYRAEQNQNVILAVDIGRLMADELAGAERVDHAIHSSLLLAQIALKNGDLVALQTYADKAAQWLPAGGGMRQLGRLRRVLADTETCNEETNHVIGIHSILRAARRRSLVVIFSEFADATTAELLVEYLGELSKRHLVIFVVFDDALTAEALNTRPVDADDLGAAIVSSSLRTDRDRVLRRLQRMGIDVVHAAPGPAALAVLERYTRVKRRGLLG